MIDMGQKKLFKLKGSSITHSKGNNMPQRMSSSNSSSGNFLAEEQCFINLNNSITILIQSENEYSRIQVKAGSQEQQHEMDGPISVLTSVTSSVFLIETRLQFEL